MTLYSESNCTGHALHIGPNSAISKLDQYDMDGDDWNNQIKSFRAYFRNPDTADNPWSEDTPKDGALKQRYAADKRTDAAWSMLESVLGTAVLAIPGGNTVIAGGLSVGTLLSNALGVLWPTGPLDDRVMEDTKAWILMQTYKLYDVDLEVFDTTSLKDLRDCFFATISWNPDGTPATNSDGNIVFFPDKIRDLIDQIDRCYNEIDSSAVQYWQLSSVHYISVVATVAAFTWRLSLNVDFGEYTSNYQHVCNTGLTGQLPKMIGYIRDAVNQARELRTGFVSSEYSNNYSGYCWQDKYAGFHSGYFWRPSDGSDSSKVHMDYYIDNVLEPNLANDWDMVRRLSDRLEYWADLDCQHTTDDNPIPTISVRSRTGMYGDIRADTDNFPIKALNWDLGDDDALSFLNTTLSDDGEFDDKDMWLGFVLYQILAKDGSGLQLGHLGYVDHDEQAGTFSIGSIQRVVGTVGTNGYARNAIGSCVAVGTDSNQESGTVMRFGGQSEDMPYVWSASAPDGSNGRLCGICVQQNPGSGGTTRDYWVVDTSSMVRDLRPDAIRNIGFYWKFDRIIPKGTNPVQNIWLEDLVKL